MKSENAITLLVLVITIIIIIILTGITVKTGSNLLQTSNVTQYATAMRLVKARSEIVLENEYFKNGKIEVDDSLTISGDIIDNKYTTNSTKYILEKWDNNKLKENGINNSILDKVSKYFIVVFNTETMKTDEVYFSTGFVVDGQRYYSLSQAEQLVVNNTQIGEAEE